MNPSPSTPDSYPALLDRLLDGATLSEADAHALMGQVFEGQLPPERLAAILAALRARGLPDPDELVGFAKAMRTAAHRIEAPGDGPLLDNCGTGGAPHKTLNVSTASAFALAAAGIRVAKHGNRSYTRPSGSADVLEACGARLDLTPDAVQRILQREGIAFLFAPTFHPAMRHAGPVRASLGVKTVFNLLGPLTNPAGATHQVLGVYHPELIEPMAQALVRLGCQGGFVLHGLPGYDEATPAGPTQYIAIQDGQVGPPMTLNPQALMVPPCTPEDLLPPLDAAEAPRRLRAILSGHDHTAVADTVALNTGLGLMATGIHDALPEAIDHARAILDSGDALDRLDAFVAATQTEAGPP